LLDVALQPLQMLFKIMVSLINYSLEHAIFFL